VQLTKDFGKTWQNLTLNIKNLPLNAWCYHIEASAHDEATAYAVFDNHTQNDPKPYVYKTTDFGKTWQALNLNDVDGFSRCIQEDYVNPNLLFLGTEKGLYITVDGGKNWSKFENNMPAASVMHIELHPKTNDLILATHGRGVIIIDDISPLRQITPEILSKEVHFFENKPFEIPEKSGFGTTSYELEFVGENPSTSARIVYYLKKRHTFGKMEMEIRDSQNNKVVSLSPGKQKGINIVTWDFATKTPKIAKGKTISFGGFSPLRAPKGSYKVVLTKGSEVFEQPFQLINDSNSTISDKDRLEQNQTAKMLFDQCEMLAYMVYELDEMLDLNQKILDKEPKNKTNLKLKTDLNALKNSMVVTTGDMYVDSAEPQLREKLSTIYAAIAGQFDAPSASQKENIENINDLFDKAKVSFDNIKSKSLKALIDQANKQNLKWEIKRFEDFVKE
jgi:hypothetical protein